MRRDGEDFVASAKAAAGDRYAYVLDGGPPIPDPVSRFLPDGVHGPSEIVDAAAFQWSDHGWRGLALRDYVIYELHVGDVHPGRYLRQRSCPARLPDAVGDHGGRGDAGVGVSRVRATGDTTASRPMPCRPATAVPKAFKRFIDAAHRRGLAVILDVVYNHLGPEGNYLRNFAPYFTAHHKTPWGDAVNYDAPGCEHVRRYVVENALYWIREFHLDGLRLDAVQTIKDDSPQHILAEIQQRVQALARELGRSVNVIAETDENDSRYTKAVPQTAAMVWTRCGATTFIMPCMRIFTGERQGYYQGFGEPDQIARALREGYIFQGEHFPFWNAATRDERERCTAACECHLPAKPRSSGKSG